MSKHVREQVLDYVAQLLKEATGVVDVKVHRIGPGQMHIASRIEVYIDGETTGGSNSEDEFEDTLEASARIAALGVRITVKSDGYEHPHTTANEILAQVEIAIATEEGTGDHEINGAQVSLQWAGIVSDDDDELDNEVVQLEVAYQASYRTPVGDPLTLI